MKWKKLTQHQKNTAIKMIIGFMLGSLFAIQSMGIYDYLYLVGMFGAIFGLAYSYEYIKKRYKK